MDIGIEVYQRGMSSRRFAALLRALSPMSALVNVADQRTREGGTPMARTATDADEGQRWFEELFRPRGGPH